MVHTKNTLLIGILVVAAGSGVFAAETVPTDIQQPGTQPTDGITFVAPSNCDNCHAGTDNEALEPFFTWQGTMMAQAGRDPIFWATVAISEQDFDGSGDLCIRCHSTTGWFENRSHPTDGSGLAASDDDGVDCEFCHLMTNPDDSEHLGVQLSPFIANDGGSPPSAYYGSGMTSISSGSDRFGPYSDPAANHGAAQSVFHRSVDYCGSCHDVSNPAVGDLAHNNGTQPTADSVVSNGVPGAAVDGKAAFNNFPHQYGVVERTFSEYKSSLWPTTLVSDFATLPPELQLLGGAVEIARTKALAAGTNGNYADGALRYFSCQTCHLSPATGKGCNKNNAPVRTDLPVHDMTGGNYWMPEAIKYLDDLDLLFLGGGLSADQIRALDAVVLRAKEQLNMAASLTVNGNTLKINNLTGHKLISGYPEGRRMWLNIKWYDAGPTLLREDGKYGTITVDIDGSPTPVDSILDLHNPNTKIYEAHYGMTQEWADQLLTLGKPADLPLSFDRSTGAVDYTLGELAAQAPGTDHETFHFVINNTVIKDNRIPPYGMDYETARQRNCLPVPATQYGGGVVGSYLHYDQILLNPPSGAVSATIELLYQPTSWEYVQFLDLANDGSVATLAAEGSNFLDAWLNTGMATPYVMASTTWADGAGACSETTPLTASTWKMISLPCDVGTANSVEEVMTPLDPLTYDTQWVVYRRNETTEAYEKMVLTDTLDEGDGYWISTDELDQTVNISGASNAPIDSPLVGDSDGRQNMVGYPYTVNLPWSQIKVWDGTTELTLAQADPEDGEGVRACEDSPARSDCVISRVANIWNGNAYEPFDGETPGMEGALKAFDGVWVEAFKTSGSAVRFSLDKATGEKREATPAGRNSGIAPSAIPGWYVRLIAESGNLRDAANVLGQLPDSEDSKDKHDLLEPAPFGDHYLSVIFPHDDWGQASGDYSSDYRRSTRKVNGEWRFAIRYSDSVDHVKLSWDGPKDVLRHAWLIDEKTEKQIKVKPGESYSFPTDGGGVNTMRYFRFVVHHGRN